MMEDFWGKMSLCSRIVVLASEGRVDGDKIVGPSPIVKVGPLAVSVAIILTVGALAREVVPGEGDTLREGGHDVRTRSVEVGGKGLDTVGAAAGVPGTVHGDQQGLGTLS